MSSSSPAPFSSEDGESSSIVSSNNRRRNHLRGSYEGIHLQPITISEDALPISSAHAATTLAAEADNNINNEPKTSTTLTTAEVGQEETSPVVEQFQQEYSTPPPPSNNNHHHGGHHDPLEVIHVLGIPMTRRKIGMAGALFNGIWGGSIMAPMHWCHDDSTRGVSYLISFGIGAAIVTSFLWMIRWMANLAYYKSATLAYQALPSFHLHKMWCAGGTSGLLWSIGNFFSLISVYYLGEGVGYSVVQAGMLVSGLWGIFYFHEIQGLPTIARWMASASITVAGIILLSYEHHKRKGLR